MVYLRYLLVVVGLTQWAKAQGVILSSCASMCVSIMAVQTAYYGCSAPSDLNCYCPQVAWGNGVRDCARDACQSTDVDQAISFINSCRSSVAMRTVFTPAVVSSAVFSTPLITRIIPTTSTLFVTVTSPASFLSRSLLPTSTTYITPSSSPSPASGTTGLPTGTKIGLAAGIPCAAIFIAIVGLAIFFLRKRRSRAQDPARYSPDEYQQGQYHQPSVQYTAHPTSNTSSGYWQGQAPQSAGSDGNKVRGQEMGTLANRSELPGKTYRGY